MGANRRLHLDGQPVEMQQHIRLSWMQATGALWSLYPP
jgi:hypothetical protein